MVPAGTLTTATEPHENGQGLSPGGAKADALIVRGLLRVVYAGVQRIMKNLKLPVTLWAGNWPQTAVWHRANLGHPQHALHQHVASRAREAGQQHLGQPSSRTWVACFHKAMQEESEWMR